LLIFALQLPNTSHIISPQVFTGSQNTDVDPRLVKNTDFIDALNIRNGHGVGVGAVTNLKGNVNVDNINLPATGTNKCVGTYEDRDNNSIIFFVWNSLNDHRIFRFSPPSTITEIARGSVLGFDQNRPIHSIKLVDNTFLYWTDARKSGQTLAGQPPRKINIKTSVIVGRKTRYELLFPSLNASNISIIQNDFDGTNTVTLGTITPTTISATITQLNAITGITVIDSTPNKIIIESAVSKRLSLNLGTNFIGFAPLDSYTFPLQAQHISWAKAMPINKVVALPTTGTSFSWDKTPQLCYSYVFRDGEYSAWSPFSSIVNPTDGNVFKDFDITYSIRDTRLSDPNWLCLIKAIRVAVKVENFGILQQVGILELSQLKISSTSLTTDFKVGQSNYLPVASDDNTSTADAQTLKLFDRIPILSETMDMIADENGATRSFLGGNVHEYDNLLAVNSNFDAVNQWIDVNDDLLRQSVTLRQGGQYNYGFVYYDEIGRQSAVQPAEKLLPIPSLTDGYATWLQAIPQISISHKAPTWAKKYQIVRTKELTAAAWKVYEAELLLGGLEGGELTIGTPTVNQEPVMFWKLKGVAKNIASGVTTVIFDTDTNLDNIASKGDAIRAFSKVDTAIITGNLGGGVIRGYHIDSAGDYGVITDIWFNVGAAPTPCFAELYTPTNKSVTSEIYYETGLIFDVDSNGNHLGNPQNQTVSQPALVNFVGGDTAWSKVKIDISGTPTQIPIPYHLRNNEDIGRIAVVDPNRKQRYYWDEISFSGVFIPYAQQNSLSSFRSLDTQRVEQNYGAIRRLVHLRDTLLAVCEFKTQPIYISKDRVLSLNGSSQVGRTDRIMNIAQETVHDYGSMNPESVSYFDGRIYAFDLHNGIVWRYAADGQTDLSAEGKHNYFNAIGQARRLYNELDNRIISNIDTRYKTVHFTFYSRSGSGIASFTEGYEDSEMSKGWKGNFSFTPEMYGRIGQFFATFVDGEMWLHDSSVVAACNFYGVQYPSYIEFVHNAEPASIKTPYKIIEQATDIWIIDKAETYPTLSYPNPQISKIPSTRFGVYEGKIEGEFLRNLKDDSQEFAVIEPTELREASALLRGALLKYDAMKVRLLKRNPQTLGTILKVDISFSKSENTI